MKKIIYDKRSGKKRCLPALTFLTCGKVMR
jgi:hypothetical protein